MSDIYSTAFLKPNPEEEINPAHPLSRGMVGGWIFTGHNWRRNVALNPVRATDAAPYISDISGNHYHITPLGFSDDVEYKDTHYGVACGADGLGTSRNAYFYTLL